MPLSQNEYQQQDGFGLAELIKKKEISKNELLEIAIAAIEKYNPSLNAVIHKMYDLAKEQLATNNNSGLFNGVPFLLKDLIVDYAGVPTSNGSKLRKKNVLLGGCYSNA